jgi:hypothetical protein
LGRKKHQKQCRQCQQEKCTVAENIPHQRGFAVSRAFPPDNGGDFHAPAAGNMRIPCANHAEQTRSDEKCPVRCFGEKRPQHRSERPADIETDTDLTVKSRQSIFFSIVDEADLLSAMEAAGMEVPACACTDKCMAGAVNTDCPVCATNMTECVGVEPEPVEDTEPVDDPEPEQPEDTDGNMGTILLILAIAAVGGGAGWYFKVYRPKQQRATEAVEEDYGDELDAFDDLEDDTPPWDEDEV